MICELYRGARDNAPECFEVEAKPQLTTLSQQVISFSQEEIASASLLAYLRTEGTTKAITISDVLYELGIIRGSRIWENRNKVVSSQLISNILIKMGFSRLNTRKARFILAEA